jgi:hypothetical protein
LLSLVSFGPVLKAGLLVAVGALIAVQFGGATAHGATMLARSASCTGLNFHPIDSSTTYSYYHSELVRTTSNGDGWFYCNLELPNNAVVTKVQFTLEDGNAAGAVRYCGLFRNDLDSAHVAEYQPVAQIPSTGDNAAPHTVRLSTQHITNGRINNSRYAYWAQCQIDTHPFYDKDLGIYGMDVIYTISSANG